MANTSIVNTVETLEEEDGMKTLWQVFLHMLDIDTENINDAQWSRQMSVLSEKDRKLYIAFLSWAYICLFYYFYLLLTFSIGLFPVYIKLCSKLYI